MFKDLFVASGVGVGGGSLVYANTLYRAKPEFFAHPGWSGLADWQAELAPHYDEAERMLQLGQDQVNRRWAEYEELASRPAAMFAADAR